jgi:hypothetical protein
MLGTDGSDFYSNRNNLFSDRAVGSGNLIWTPNFSHYLKVQADGNVAVYTFDGAPTWESGTATPTPARFYSLALGADCNLVLRAEYTAIWSSSECLS